MITYFCDKDEIETNAQEQINSFGINDNIAVFPDVHYCSEKNLPIGIAFTSDLIYPLITGKDIGCGVMYLKFKKSNLIKPFDKNVHYNTFDKQSYKMTDDGLGGGNHFLSIEEGDDDFIYIICHTGSRNLGIALYQRFLKLIDEFNYSQGLPSTSKYLDKSIINEDLVRYYNQVLDFATNRRKDFVLKTLMMLQTNGYVDCNKASIDKSYITKSFKEIDNEGQLNETYYKIQDSIHNHIRFTNENIVHRKGATELIIGSEVVIPLSMTRGSLIVKPNYDVYNLELANMSCSHGAGRALSRTDTLKHWNSGMKESERKMYRKNFSELLDRSGDFPRGYIHEFDFAYKSSQGILKMQPHITKVTQTTPIATVKFTEI